MFWSLTQFPTHSSSDPRVLTQSKSLRMMKKFSSKSPKNAIPSKIYLLPINPFYIHDNIYLTIIDLLYISIFSLDLCCRSKIIEIHRPLQTKQSQPLHSSVKWKSRESMFRAQYIGCIALVWIKKTSDGPKKTVESLFHLFWLKELGG